MSKPRARARRRKVAVVSSRLKGFLSFQELFQSGLRNGWKVVRSGWSAGSGTVSASNPTQYPLLSTTMSKTNVTIEITDPGIGTGAALWVTDSGNWYGVVTSQEVSSGTGNCGTYSAINNCGYTNPCIPTGGSYTNSGYEDFGYQCINTSTYSWNGNPASYGNYSCSCPNANNCAFGYVASGNYSLSYCANISYSANYCGYYTQAHQYYDNCKTGGNCVATGGNCRTYGNCLVYGGYYIACCKAYNTYNSCAYTNPCVGGYIYWTTQESLAPCCALGYTADYVPSNCATGSPSTNNACGYCGTIEAQPAGSVTNNCSCCGRTAQDIRLVLYPQDSYNPCGAGGNCVQTGGNCTNYQDTYPRKIKIFKYASNVLTEVASQTLDSLTSYAAIRSLKIIVTNAVKGGSTATITTKTYSDTLFANQIGSDFIHQATGLKVNTNYGIIANPSAYNQNISVQKILIS
jgi:hypothetical protein